VTRAPGASEASARYAPSLEGEPGVSCIRSGEHSTYPGCGLILTLSAPEQGLNLGRFKTLHVR